MNDVINKAYFYILILISFISITGALVYKFYKLNNLGIFLNLILSIVLLVIILSLRKKYKKDENKLTDLSKKTTIDNYFKEKVKINPNKTIWGFLYILIFSICTITLFKNSTVEAIASPWQTMPSYFFFLFTLLSFLLIVNISKNKRLNLLLISLHFFLSFSVAVIVYKLGFGFDPFIHNASLDYIKQHAEVLPKPFYYLGYYPIIIMLNKLSFIPIAVLNKFIVPILSAIFLPFIFYKLGNFWFDNKKAVFLSITFLLILPFSIFTISTPQNLAFLFLVLAVITSIMANSFFDLLILALLSLTSFVIHPIAGIPAIILFVSTLVFRLKLNKLKKYLFLFLLIINTISLPLAFYFINHQNSSASIEPSINSISINNLKSFFHIQTAGDENVILNFTYLFIFNFKFVIILLIFIGFFLLVKYKKQCSQLFMHSALGVSLLLSFCLTKTLPFDFLISYERENYSLRILINAIIFLLPLIFIAIHGSFLKILKENRTTKIIIFFSLTLFLSISLYMNYPRKDHYFNTHSFSVSKSDIESVKWIEDNTENDYIVLANQQVSAAALNQYGFKKYFKAKDDPNTSIFFYPIPTGGAMYQLYLDMVYQSPSKETMKKAMDLAQVHEAYFILNDYWWAFPKILNEAKNEADEYIQINDGQNYIFKYSK